MPRWLVAFVLALVLPCYGFAAAGQMLAMAEHDSSHALAHMAGEAHHHHDDGSFDVDDSDESVRHLQAHDALLSPVLLPAALTVDPMPAVATVLDGWDTSLAPPPFLEGPRRPPRSLADLS